jgi:hypothetical protein
MAKAGADAIAGQTTVTASRPQIRCREIGEGDLDRVADLLTRGFAGRSRDYWMQGLRRQAARRDVPQGYPRFGYMLDHDGAPVGALLLLYTLRPSDGELSIHCNLSSWYVEPAFRNYAPMLAKIAQRHNDVTYFNISPARWTWPIVEAQGFNAYCRGLFFSFPLITRPVKDMTVEIVTSDATEVDGLPASEVELLTRHAAYGCLSLVCRTATAVTPFVLQPMRIRRGRISLPAMQLIYCRDVADYVACAGVLGKLLARRGKFSVALDANGPVEGVTGIYTERRGRKYCKGPHRPRLADLSDTELVLYGP